MNCNSCGGGHLIEGYCEDCAFEIAESNESLITENARLRDILRDAWNQFAVEKPDGTKWHGGLSTLKDVESALQEGPGKKEGE